ncbi:hypothetical protein MTAT_26400 [Moorella thermoacetica]|uniref:Uncharacterized protein n=1 Tax=Neomoorella thermoacetica TaxID=1525 RepID=A0AAC9MTZ3_NEOTH|nr:hypothetical protein [Moorella thermoacetica]AOQ23057.1 hypothetical protein Maut_00594 [Moorella thermoacetica]TYL08976.1 hypothetical protein MTAT_26400 [Moorella thermoacetica]
MKVSPEELEKYLSGQSGQKPAGKPGDGDSKNAEDASVKEPSAGQEVRGGSGTAPPTKDGAGNGRAASGGPPAPAGKQEKSPEITGLPDDLASDELFAAELEAETAALPEVHVSRVVINHESGTFDYLDGRSSDVLEGFLVRWDNRRVRWDDGGIACLSRDGKRGRLADGTVVECARCVHSGQCVFSPRLYFVPAAGVRELLYFDVPSGQSSVFYRFVNSVVRGADGGPARPLSSVVTRARLEKREGRRAARLAFEVVRPVAGREEWREILALRDELLPHVVEDSGGNAGEAAAGPSLEDVVF